MTDSNNQLAVQQPRALASVAALTGLDQKYIIDTLKAQCFKGQASDAQVDAFISIAMEMKVNPLLPGMLYAYPTSGGGIVPIMGPSGVYKKLTEHPDVDSWNVEVFPADVTQPPTHATARIYRKGTDRPLEYTALLSEWKVGSNKNWVDRPRHMLQLRALKHCANQIIHGIPYDEDDRIIMGDPINVTSTGGTVEAQQPPIQRADPKPRKGAALAKEKAAEVVVEPYDADKTDTQAVMEAAKLATEPKNVTPEPAAVEAVQAINAKLAEPVKSGRTSLNDGEKLTANVEVVSIEPVAAKIDGKIVPSIRAVVKGDFNGKVQHKGAGKVHMDDKGVALLNDKGAQIVDPAAPWVVGDRVTLKLYGEKSKATTGPMVGTIVAWVESAEAMVEDFG